MRYIDVDALIEFIDMGHYRNPLELCYSEQSVVDMLESRPTADVVEVVRCKDCKYYREHTIGNNFLAMMCFCPCCLGGQGVKSDDDYCSYGERREE